jgi:hypothetical protein
MKISHKTQFIIPGIVRLRDAPFYLGMNKTFFRNTVQPYLTRIPIDQRGIGFNRIELDRWIAYTQATLGQPPLKQPPWENPDTAASFTESSSRRAVGAQKPTQKLKVRKATLRGKPTPTDFCDLVNQMMTLPKPSS